MLDIDLKGEYTFLMDNLFIYNMCMYIENMHFYWSIHMRIFKENQLVENNFCITDMYNLVSISWF